MRCCNAGRGYVKRAGLNQYERRAGHPEAGLLAGGPRGWQEGRSNSLEGRKPVVQRHRNACSPATAEGWQKAGQQGGKAANSAMQHL